MNDSLAGIGNIDLQHYYTLLNIKFTLFFDKSLTKLLVTSMNGDRCCSIVSEDYETIVKRFEKVEAMYLHTVHNRL